METSQFPSADGRGRWRLAELHRELLRLHKVLLDSEQNAYEKVHGKIPGKGQLLNLVMHDPWFDWLHRISEMIVRIDEVMELEDATVEDTAALLEACRQLFRASSDSADTEFMQRYKAVLKRDPGAILEHAAVQRVLLQ